MGIGDLTHVEAYSKIQELIDTGIYDTGRLRFIQMCLRQGKTLYNSDKKYLENKLRAKNPQKQSSIPTERNDLLECLSKIIEWRLGDVPRLQYIHDSIKKRKTLYKSDERYLKSKLTVLMSNDLIGAKLVERKSVDTEAPKSHQIHKCAKCSDVLKLDEETIRQDNQWYHANCKELGQKPIKNHVLKLSITSPVQQPSIEVKKTKEKLDPVQLTLSITIFSFLVIASYLFLGNLSVIAMSFGGGLMIFQLLSARKAAHTKLQYGRRGPSVFMLFLLLTPFGLGTMIAMDGYSLWESPVRMFLLWGMTIAFWSTMLFVPMAVYSKYKENLQPEPKEYPSITVLVPAYNEEKVIAKTIEGLIETDYPKKEIIVIDDGSKDRTLDIAKQYKDQVKILHKENGGKATALNYGLNYATGEIIVIVDADTIVGRRSLKQIIRGFYVSENVAAVAGNIKVRNRINWLTNCQALEYITGIQIVRRAFDLFGAITIIPGALGAFKKNMLETAGAYHKDTIVEDFDATVKILKSGLITQGSTQATAYTEAPSTINDFVKQRKRWYRGNIQVLQRHADAITNPRFGYLQRLAFPYMIIGMLVTPIIGFVSAINAIIAIIQGDWIFVLQVFVIFTVVHYLMAALAIRIDEDDPKLLAYAGFLVLGFKQIVDYLLLKAMLEHAFGKKAIWTSAKRTGT